MSGKNPDHFEHTPWSRAAEILETYPGPVRAVLVALVLAGSTPVTIPLLRSLQEIYFPQPDPWTTETDKLNLKEAGIYKVTEDISVVDVSMQYNITVISENWAEAVKMFDSDSPHFTPVIHVVVDQEHASGNSWAKVGQYLEQAEKRGDVPTGLGLSTVAPPLLPDFRSLSRPIQAMYLYLSATRLSALMYKDLKAQTYYQTYGSRPPDTEDYSPSYYEELIATGELPLLVELKPYNMEEISSQDFEHPNTESLQVFRIGDARAFIVDASNRYNISNLGSMAIMNMIAEFNPDPNKDEWLVYMITDEPHQNHFSYQRIRHALTNYLPEGALKDKNLPYFIAISTSNHLSYDPTIETSAQMYQRFDATLNAREIIAGVDPDEAHEILAIEDYIQAIIEGKLPILINLEPAP